MKRTLIFLTVSLLALTSYFFLKPATHHKKRVDFKDVELDSSYNFKTCKQISFVSLNENCNKDFYCKPGLYCSAQGKCVSGKINLKEKQEFCTSNQQCSTGVCTSNKCAETSFEKVNYCSRYLNLLSRLNKCSFRKCQTGSTFPHLSNCQNERCHRIIKQVSDAALDEFNLVFSNGKALEHERNPTKILAQQEVTGIQQTCQITSSVLSSMFGTSGSDISVIFSNPLTATTLQITALTTVFANATNLGTGATMSFVSATRLRIQLGTSPTIQPGQFLSFKDNVLAVEGCATNFVNGGITVTKDPNTVAPRVVLRGPRATTKTCDVLISASDSIGAGTLNYEWRLDNTTASYAPVAIANYLAGLTRTTSSISISKTFFQDANVTNFFKIDVTVIDYFGAQTSQSITVTVTEGAAVPLCDLLLPAGLSLDRTKANTLLADTRVCSTGSYDSVNYAFSITPSVAITQSGGSVTIPAKSLAVGTNYQISLSVTAQSGLVAVGNCTYSSALTGTNPGVIAAFAGASSVLVANSGSLQLDATPSSDPAGETVSYAYTCCKYNTNSGICVTSDCTSVFATLTSLTTSTVSLTIPAGTLGKFRFQLTYSAGARSATAFKDVTFSDAGGIKLDSVNVDGTYTFATDFDNPTGWTATLLFGSFTVQPSTASGRKFSVLVPRDSVVTSGTLRVVAKNPVLNKDVVFDYPIVKEIPPFNGNVRIILESGEVATGALNSNNVYFVEAIDWKSDNTIQYEFFSTLAGSQSFSTRTRFKFQPNAVAVATAGSFAVKIGYVSPVFGDYVSTTQTVTFNVAVYTPPSGQTYEQASQTTINAISAAAASGDTSAVLSSANRALSILAVSTTARGDPNRISTLNRLATLLISSTPAAITSPADRTTSLAVTTALIASPTEVTATVRNAAITSITASFTTPLPLSSTEATSALGTLSTILSITPVAGDILQSSGLLKDDALKLKKAASGIANSVALTVTNFTAPTYVNSAALRISTHKFRFSIPTSEIVGFADGSVTLTAPGGLGSGTANIDSFNLHFIKWNRNYFTYATSPGRNITSVPVGVELYNAVTNAVVPVANVQPNFNIRIVDNNTSLYSSCLYLDDANSKWDESGVSASIITAGVSVVCQTSHLTEFGVFANPAPAPTNPTQNNDLLYLLLLLLLIPIAIVVAIIIIVAIVLITARIRNNSGYSKGGLHATAGVGLEDLGI